MEKLLTKIGAPSYLPTPAEVLDGVRWLRENPAIAAGVVVGLTSYSVAKYYEYGEDSDEEENAEENDENTDHHQDNAARATPEEIARSVTALHLGLLNIDTAKNDRRDSAADSSASTASSLASSGGLRSRASSVFDKAFHEELQLQEHGVEQVWSCLHEGDRSSYSRRQQERQAAMTYYRIGQRLKMTRAVARAMARSSAGKRNSAAIEKMVQTSKSRFGSAVGRPLGAALATFLDSGVAFNTSSEFLFFDGEDDDGT
ncbi:Thiosulfate sulfurtransferase/rhodanese domain-containing protein 2 [Phytophthora cinnamomi]|uniref:Thiosulfate sulfurtransferase/rhodanese domain-containing protein 2 n=1 Tax=Phytophthora cinnamomi TaxID=4785 RepID=UPI003559747C|nr:Thiosulfate sulfurtransferase/rhodanese domain-containing protein 2 [Phytophthora cinnamomi]